MKLHANATLSLNQRRAADESTRRVGRWRRSREVSGPPPASGRALPLEGEVGLLDRSSAAQRGWNRPPRSGRGDLRPAAPAPHRRRDRRLLEMRCRPSGGCSTGRAGPLALARRLERRTATSASARASCVQCRRQEARADRWGRALGPQSVKHLAPRAAWGAGGSSSTSAIDDATRLAYAEVLSTKGDERGRLPRRAPPSTPPAGQRRAGDDRQRLGLHPARPFAISPAAARAKGTSAPAPTAPDQRQGRALHPDDARWLGLWGDLPSQPWSAPELWRGGFGATTSGRPHGSSAEGHRQLDSLS